MPALALCLFLVSACTCWADDVAKSNPKDIWIKFAQCQGALFSIEGYTDDPLMKGKAYRAYSASLSYRMAYLPMSEWAGAKLNDSFFPQLEQDWIVLHEAQDRLIQRTGYGDYFKLGAAIDDIYYKTTACIQNGSKAIGSVSVKVRTWKSGTEVQHLRVFCIAKILKLFAQFSPTMFPQFSSPSEWDLAPGNYIMWTVDPSTGVRSAEEEIPIDHNQECDLVAP